MTKPEISSIFADLRHLISVDPDDFDYKSKLLLEHEPVDIFHDESDRWFTVSISPVDKLGDCLGTFKINEDVFMVYETFKGVTTLTEVKGIDYKFNEGDLIRQFQEYVDSTYGLHYSGKYQATDMIIDAGHGVGFCIGSIMKYARRLGKKKGYNRDDILKIMHYALILQYALDQEKQGEQK